MHPFLGLMFVGLSLLGALSPLLTFAALFQQKEWRLDRLKEHLRRDGWFGQLTGRIRPAAAIVWMIAESWSMIAVLNTGSGAGTSIAATQLFTVKGLCIAVFAGLSIMQIVLRRQRYPVWTRKALMIVGLSLVLNVLATIVFFPVPLVQPALMIGQSVVVLAAWGFLLPVDRVLKKRVLTRGAAARASVPGAIVIGIAGSVGKTTTKELTHHLLQDKKPLMTPAHVNTEMGVAAWLERNAPDARTMQNPLLIVEMGAYRAGEIALLCRIAQPTIGVMTALGSDHVALFGSEQEIDEANAELLNALPASGHAFLNGYNERARALAPHATCPVTVTDNAQDVQETAEGLTFAQNGTRFTAPLHGRHNIENILLAIAVARHLGIADARIAELLKSFHPAAHTFNVRTERGILLLDDTYNISPLSMKAALAWAQSRTERPRTLLTSGLQETGEDEAAYLKELGALARDSVERVIFTQAHGADIFGAAYGKPVEVLNDQTPRVMPGSALLCVGRMPLSTMQKLLPL